MFNFKITKNSKKSRARLGVLETTHGIVETPALVPVATQATIKTLDVSETIDTKSQLLIANTFHLHLKPGEKIIKSAGGLNKFSKWPHTFMTDSGGYQVFSLGFGTDLGTGKILKERPGEEIKVGQQPKLIKITEDGVHFRSPLDGRKLFLGPKESIKIQEDLGADIIFAFDECPPPSAGYEYTKKSLEKTHRWAKICLDTKKSDQALYGIVQGGKFKDLRKLSSKYIGSLSFAGFGIGGEFGISKKEMVSMLKWTLKELPREKPIHLLGVGGLEDIPLIIKEGVDTFDCTIPTHYARRGIAFTNDGKLDLRKIKFLKEKKALDKKCDCKVCQTYTRQYLSHLIRAHEITGMKLLTFHNLYFFNSYIEALKERIRRGKL